MGKASRERRRRQEEARLRESQAARQQAARQQATRTQSTRTQRRPWEADRTQDVAELVQTALSAFAFGDEAGFELATKTLAEPPEPGWRTAVEGALTACLAESVTTAWRRGWQPADLFRLAARQLPTDQLRLLADAIAAELRGYAAATIDPQWPAQLAQFDARVWWPPDQTHLRARLARGEASGEASGETTRMTLVREAIEVLHLLVTLPDIEHLGPMPGQALPPVHDRSNPHRDVDDRILERVRALLAKAESTSFEAEAETFTAGAQALMARHSIDMALLAATATGTRPETSVRRIGIDNPYEGPKASLLQAVAGANRCRSVWSRQLGFSTVVGFPPDLEAVETLFTSLLVQATRAVTQAGSRTDRYGRSRTRSFRQSFLTAYAHRIGERLSQAAREQTAAAAAEAGGSRLLPVLAARDHEVEQAFTTMFPTLVSRSVSSVTNREGWMSGRSAADRAILDARAPLPG